MKTTRRNFFASIIAAIAGQKLAVAAPRVDWAKKLRQMIREADYSTHQRALDVLNRQIAWLIFHEPFWASLLMRLPRVPVRTLVGMGKSIAITGKAILFDPGKVALLDEHGDDSLRWALTCAVEDWAHREFTGFRSMIDLAERDGIPIINHPLSETDANTFRGMPRLIS